MVSVNVVVLAGRLSDAPELKTMPSGDQVARFRLAIPEEGKRLLPLPVSVWDRLPRRACEALAKGDPVLVRHPGPEDALGHPAQRGPPPALVDRRHEPADHQVLSGPGRLGRAVADQVEVAGGSEPAVATRLG